MTVHALLAGLDGLLGHGRVTGGSAAPAVRRLTPPAVPSTWSSPAAGDLEQRNFRLTGHGEVFAASDDDASGKVTAAGAAVGAGKEQMGRIRDDYRLNHDRMAPASSNPEIAARMAELDRQRAADGANTVRSTLGRLPQVGGSPAGMAGLGQMMPAAMGAMTPALTAPLQAFSGLPALMAPATSMLSNFTLPQTITHPKLSGDHANIDLETYRADLTGDLPPGVADERGLQNDTILAARAVSAAFPEIDKIGGMRPDHLKWHPNGQAIDVMIPDPTSPSGKALGDQILSFVMRHQAALHLNHICWQQRLYFPNGTSQPMSDLGNATANHFDHVHIATDGGGYPHGGEAYHL